MHNVKELKPGDGNLSLILGVDGSGKSTFLSGLNNCFGTVILEPTSSREVRDFKLLNADTLIDESHITSRESVFLSLNQEFDQTVLHELHKGDHVATTGNTLVTLTSHGLMRTILSNKYSQQGSNITRRWIDSDSLKPASIVLVHAPDHVIRERIADRQKAGDQLERFWGFNSPYFLSRYQETWHKVIMEISDNTDIRCIDLDSSKLSPSDMIRLSTTVIND